MAVSTMPAADDIMPGSEYRTWSCVYKVDTGVKSI